MVASPTPYNHTIFPLNDDRGHLMYDKLITSSVLYTYSCTRYPYAFLETSQSWSLRLVQVFNFTLEN